MFNLEWWILILITVVCNLVWPPITLAITLWWGIRSTNKTLSYAQSIERKVTKAIDTLNQDIKTEDTVASIVEAQTVQMKAMLDGFRGDIIKKVENEITTAKQQIVQQAPSHKVDTNELIMAGMAMLGGAGQ